MVNNASHPNFLDSLSSLIPGIDLASSNDWTGITDPKQRRKIQNRLNQRRRRTRLQDKMPAKRTAISKKITSAVSQDVTGDTRQIEAFIYSRLFGDPRSDFLLSLVEFNVIRALLKNMVILGLSATWLLDKRAISSMSTSKSNENVPPYLRPTALQKKMNHALWLDPFPFPGMRDNILKVYNLCDRDALYGAMVGWHSNPGTRLGLVVWGEPWNPAGWEVTQDLYDAFGWALDGCPELIHSSNFWRAQRDMEPLRLASPMPCKVCESA